MWDKLQCVNGRVTVSSCIHESEMQPRTDFRLGDPPRLLFVGYIRPEKGVDILLDAFDHIRQRRKIKLTIVGKSDRASGAEELALQRIRQSPFRDDIEVKGMLNYGSELFDLYRSHDLYVLSSLSEGTPRTLVEARGFGCPVVATNVGVSQHLLKTARTVCSSSRAIRSSLRMRFSVCLMMKSCA